jgi:hypothetical protein
MNGFGLATGVRLRLPPGCTPATCLRVPEAVVWAGDTAMPLPLLPGFSTVTPVGINASGWVAGYAGDPMTTGGRAVVWKPAAGGYTAIDLGVVPGTSRSWAAGIDDQGRAIGWSTTGSIPTATAPFVWTEAGGLVDLAARGSRTRSRRPSPGRERGHGRFLVSRRRRGERDAAGAAAAGLLGSRHLSRRHQRRGRSGPLPDRDHPGLLDRTAGELTDWVIPQP